jgi:ceramide glucosyltransferase
MTHPFGWALLAMLVGGFEPGEALLFCVAVLCRLTLQDEVDRRFPAQIHAIYLAPLRDLLGFALFWASFLPSQLHWRGQDFELRDDGVMTPIEEERAEAVR